MRLGGKQALLTQDQCSIEHRSCICRLSFPSYHHPKRGLLTISIAELLKGPSHADLLHRLHSQEVVATAILHAVKAMWAMAMQTGDPSVGLVWDNDRTESQVRSASSGT